MRLFILFITLNFNCFTQVIKDSILFNYEINESISLKWKIYLDKTNWNIKKGNNNFLNLSNDSSNISFKVINLRELQNIPRDYKKMLNKKEYSKFITNAYIDNIIFDLNKEIIHKEIIFKEETNEILIYFDLHSNKMKLNFFLSDTPYVFLMIYNGQKESDLELLEIIEI